MHAGLLSAFAQITSEATFHTPERPTNALSPFQTACRIGGRRRSTSYAGAWGCMAAGDGDAPGTDAGLGEGCGTPFKPPAADGGRGLGDD